MPFKCLFATSWCRRNEKNIYYISPVTGYKQRLSRVYAHWWELDELTDDSDIRNPGRSKKGNNVGVSVVRVWKSFGKEMSLIEQVEFKWSEHSFLDGRNILSECLEVEKHKTILTTVQVWMEEEVFWRKQGKWAREKVESIAVVPKRWIHPC